MEIYFKNKELLRIFETGRETGKPKFSKEVIKGFIKKVYILAAAENSRQLVQMKSLYFEALKKELKGFHAVRINDQYRLIFKIVKERDVMKVVLEKIEIHKIMDYH